MNLAKTHSSQTETNMGTDGFDKFIVIGYTPVGTIHGGYGMVEVHARETVIAATNMVEQHIRFEVNSGDEYAQSTIASINLKNVDTFISHLEKLQQTSIDKDRFEFTEIQVESDELRIVVFNNDRNQIMWACQCQDQSVHFNSLSKITELKKLVEKAKGQLKDR